MKIVFEKIISVFLLVMLILSVIQITTFASSDNYLGMDVSDREKIIEPDVLWGEVLPPVLEMKKVSQDVNDEIIVNIELTESSFNVLELTFVLQGLDVMSIASGDAAISSNAEILAKQSSEQTLKTIRIEAPNGMKKGIAVVMRFKRTALYYKLTVESAFCSAIYNSNIVNLNPVIKGEIFSEGVNDPNIKVPVFDVCQVSKTDNKIVVNIDLIENTFNALDLVFELKGLSCEVIKGGDAISSSGAMLISNTRAMSGKSNISIASTENVKIGTLATVTLKITSDEDYKFVVKAESCYITDFLGNNNPAYPTISGEVKKDPHKHEFSKITTPATCIAKGFECEICIHCGATENLKEIPLTDHAWSKWRSAQVEDYIEEYRFCKVCEKVERRVVEKVAKVNFVDISDISINYKNSTTITPEINADKGVEYTIVYSSSNPSVANIDANGKVTATGTGSATITCTVTDEYGNVVTDTCEVKVSYNWWQWIIVIVLFGWIWY